MAGENLVIIIGNLGRDPEMRYTQAGTAVVNFTVAETKTWRNANGGKEEKVRWHRIVAWKNLAEICGKYLRKGSQVYIRGEIDYRDWTDKDGVKHQTTEIIAQTMQMLGGPKQGGGQSDPDHVAEPNPDDIPF